MENRGRVQSNRLLFTFDCLLDRELGIVNALREDFLFNKGESPNEFINYSFLLATDEELYFHRMYDMGFDILKHCLVNIDDPSEIRKDYLTEDYERILSLSPRTNMVHLINQYTSTDFISVDIVCYLPVEMKWARHLCPNANTIIADSKTKMSLSPYARLHVADINEVYNFKDIVCKHIAVLRYVENFIETDINGKKTIMLLPQCTLPLWDTNEFRIMDPYMLKGE